MNQTPSYSFHLGRMHLCIKVIKLFFSFYARVHYVHMNITNYFDTHIHMVKMNGYKGVTQFSVFLRFSLEPDPKQVICYRVQLA